MIRLDVVWVSRWLGLSFANRHLTAAITRGTPLETPSASRRLAPNHKFTYDHIAIAQPIPVNPLKSNAITLKMASLEQLLIVATRTTRFICHLYDAAALPSRCSVAAAAEILQTMRYDSDG